MTLSDLLAAMLCVSVITQSVSVASAEHASIPVLLLCGTLSLPLSLLLWRFWWKVVEVAARFETQGNKEDKRTFRFAPLAMSLVLFIALIVAGNFLSVIQAKGILRASAWLESR